MDVNWDIGRRKKPEIRRQSHLLELVIQGASLQTILQELIQGVEEDFSGSTAFVLLLDEQKIHLFHAAHAKLPGFYINDTEGTEIASGSGSFGESGFVQHSMIAENIQENPYWQKYLQLTKEAEQGTFWSKTILSEERELLGTFAVCFAKPTTLSDEAAEMLRDASYWTGISFEKIKQHEQLRIMSLAVERSTAAAEISATESFNRMQNAFLANVSHEIRTPMNAILGFTGILLQDESLTDQQRQQLKTIAQSSEHLLNLINGVLEMSMNEAGKSTYHPAEFNLRQVLRELESQFLRRVKEKNLRLSIEFEQDLPVSIVSDKQKFLQILVNLVSNALQNTKKGTVTVRLWSRPTSDAAGRLRIFAEVEDSGPGIAAKDLAKLFAVFSQTDTGASWGETGLELSISRNYARQLGGDITVTSQLGQGSCFHVEILAEQGQGYLAEKTGGAIVTYLEPDQRQWRVLIVDNEKNNRLLLEKILHKVGFETKQAIDGENAVAICEEWSPDLVLMDVQMPIMDGYEATRRIKTLPRSKAAPVIGVSGGNLEEDRQKALTSGMEMFIRKPLKPQELLRIIEELLPVRYLYEDAVLATPIAETDPASMVDELRKIPAELIRLLGDSAESADYYQLQQGIEKTAAFSPILATYLRNILRRFNYVAFLQLVGKESAPSCCDATSLQLKPEILVVDDVPENLELLAELLKNEGYKVRPVLSGRQALELVQRYTPDLVLIDITMPDMNGYEVCAKLKATPELAEIPIIFISALAETEDKIKAFDAGGADYVEKPFSGREVRARVNTHLKLRFFQQDLKLRNINLDLLVQEKIQEITESQLTIIFALAKLSENRDEETGRHLERVRIYCRLLAQRLQERSAYADMISRQFIDNIFSTSPLHDIGKVGIPDAILLKPGKLTVEEFAVMKHHTTIGANTLAAVYQMYPQNNLISMGVEIAREHHENWDGSGYPGGLVGEKISLAARIMAVADVYDALRTKRIYKSAFSHEEACRILFAGSGKQFDPVIIEAFDHLNEQFNSIHTDLLEHFNGATDFSNNQYEKY